MGLEPAIYLPRDAEHTVLHQLISEHLETLLDAVAEVGDGSVADYVTGIEARDRATAAGWR